MLTSKQKAFLVSLSNSLKPITQIGKDGITDCLINDLLNYLRKHELMKVSILNNCPCGIEEIEGGLEKSGIDVVKLIGKTLIIYKENINLPNRIKL